MYVTAYLLRIFIHQREVALFLSLIDVSRYR